MAIDTQQPTVVQTIAAVMADLGAVTKSKRNAEQGFFFRGIDQVMNALHPALTAHGLVILPTVLERVTETRETRKGGVMNVTTLRVRFRFYGPGGDWIESEMWGESADSGDKSTGKAASMAYKSAMLQAFHIPTEDMGEADATAVEAAPAARPRTEDPAVTSAKRVLWAAAQDLGWSPATLADEYAKAHGGEVLRDARVLDLLGFAETLEMQAEALLAETSEQKP